MMVVTVEVWPGGSPRGKKFVDAMTFVNLSDLAAISEYEVWHDGTLLGRIKHRRSDGGMELVRKGLTLLETE